MTDTDLVRRLSDELVELQRPIRILNSVAWDDNVAAEFFAAGATNQPAVDADYYRNTRPLRFDPDDLRTGLSNLRSRIETRLGGSPIGDLLLGRLAEYVRVIEMVQVRGTPEFARISAELYGGPTDRMHVGGPTLSALGQVMDEALVNIDAGVWEPPDA